MSALTSPDTGALLRGDPDLGLSPGGLRGAGRRPQNLVLLGVAGLAAVALFLPRARGVPAQAHLAPSFELHALAERDGSIAAVAVREGDPVVEGALLFTWDVAEAQRELAALQQAAADDAAGPRDTLGGASLAARASRAERIEALRAEIGARHVVAPWRGEVRDLRLAAGARVQRGQRIYEIRSADTVTLSAIVRPREARLIKIGDPVTVVFGDARVKTRIEGVTALEVIARLPAATCASWPAWTPVTLELEPVTRWERLW